MNQKEAFDLVLFRFIDAHLDLYGYVQTKTICDQFYMHRTRASAVMTKYREKQPGNTRFNVNEKRHDKAYTFKKRFLKTSSLEFLNGVEVVFGQPAELNHLFN